MALGWLEKGVRWEGNGLTLAGGRTRLWTGVSRSFAG